MASFDRAWERWRKDIDEKRLKKMTEEAARQAKRDAIFRKKSEPSGLLEWMARSHPPITTTFTTTTGTTLPGTTTSYPSPTTGTIVSYPGMYVGGVFAEDEDAETKELHPWVREEAEMQKEITTLRDFIDFLAAQLAEKEDVTVNVSAKSVWQIAAVADLAWAYMETLEDSNATEDDLDTAAAVLKMGLERMGYRPPADDTYEI